MSAQPPSSAGGGGGGGGGGGSSGRRVRKVRGGAFGGLEQQKLAQSNVLRVEHEIYRDAILAQAGWTAQYPVAVDLREGLASPSSPGPAAVAAAAAVVAADRGERMVWAPCTIQALGDAGTLALGKGRGAAARPMTAESVAGDYSWRPTESLKWIPSLVPARGPVLPPPPAPGLHGQPAPEGRAYSPTLTAALESRPVTAANSSGGSGGGGGGGGGGATMVWSREGAEMNMTGPAMQVKGHVKEVFSYVSQSSLGQSASSLGLFGTSSPPRTPNCSPPCTCAHASVCPSVCLSACMSCTDPALSCPVVSCPVLQQRRRPAKDCPMGTERGRLGR